MVLEVASGKGAQIPGPCDKQKYRSARRRAPLAEESPFSVALSNTEHVSLTTMPRRPLAIVGL